MRVESKILVAVRKRPLNKKETDKKETDILETNSPDSLIVKEVRQKLDMTKYLEEHSFYFDAVFSENDSNTYIYNSIIKPLVYSAFEGTKVNCIAFGQTGSGKTFTMMGNLDNSVQGLYYISAKEIFSIQEQMHPQNVTISVSFFEIYCGNAHDLLNNREKCPIRVDGNENVNIVGLSEVMIVSVDNLMKIIQFGLSMRITGQTGMNDDSSRSHAILQINLKMNGKLHGRMSFIDLAGSERGADVVDTNKQTRFDGAEINKSLLALKECIRALDQDKRHLPFRGSKLTLVLKDSFIGKCKTVLIGNVSPNSSSCEHSLNTLRYANRVKELKKSLGSQDKQKVSKQDELARNLMLPRMLKNSNKIQIVAEEPELVIIKAVETDVKKKDVDSNKVIKSNIMDKYISKKTEDGKKSYSNSTLNNIFGSYKSSYLKKDIDIKQNESLIESKSSPINNTKLVENDKKEVKLIKGVKLEYEKDHFQNESTPSNLLIGKSRNSISNEKIEVGNEGSSSSAKNMNNVRPGKESRSLLKDRTSFLKNKEIKNDRNTKIIPMSFKSDENSNLEESKSQTLVRASMLAQTSVRPNPSLNVIKKIETSDDGPTLIKKESISHQFAQSIGSFPSHKLDNTSISQLKKQDVLKSTSFEDQKFPQNRFLNQEKETFYKMYKNQTSKLKIILEKDEQILDEMQCQKDLTQSGMMLFIDASKNLLNQKIKEINFFKEELKKLQRRIETTDVSRNDGRNYTNYEKPSILEEPIIETEDI